MELILKKLIILSLLSCSIVAELPKMSNLLVIGSVAMPVAGMYMAFDGIKKINTISYEYNLMKRSVVCNATINSIIQRNPQVVAADCQKVAEVFLRDNSLISRQDFDQSMDPSDLQRFKQSKLDAYRKIGCGIGLTSLWSIGVWYLLKHA